MTRFFGAFTRTYSPTDTAKISNSMETDKSRQKFSFLPELHSYPQIFFSVAQDTGNRPVKYKPTNCICPMSSLTLQDERGDKAPPL